jgi:hypothetical protein
MAEINIKQQACIVSCTKEEWNKFQEAFLNDIGYNFNPLLVHEFNCDKLLPEYIVDITELHDTLLDALLLHDFEEGEADFIRHLEYMQECFNIPVDTIKEYGIMQFYFEE